MKSATGITNVVPRVVESLERLDYRGYDSCGVAALNGSIKVVRRVGDSSVLKGAVEGLNLSATVALAHTRWATEGAVSEENAHPHVSEHLVITHNGTIKNWLTLKEMLLKEGYIFKSQTDTEVIAHLVHYHYKKKPDLLRAVRDAVKMLDGIYALVVSSIREPGVLIATRNHPPLLIGLGSGENFVSSDVRGFLASTRRVIHLWEGDIARVTPEIVVIYDGNDKAVKRNVYLSKESLDSLSKDPYEHFMQKEIFHQPQALADTIEEAMARGLSPELFGDARGILKRIKKVLFVACGTSYHAGLLARQWVKTVAGIEAEAVLASQYLEEPVIADRNQLVVTISQSGETFDTMQALRRAQDLGHKHTLSICNVPESSIPRASKLVFYTNAGSEVGVASTKAFTTQLAGLQLLVHTIAKAKGQLTRKDEAAFMATLRELPRAAEAALKLEPQIVKWAEILKHRKNALFLGSGPYWPIAMEAALKLKEISYIHAEALAAGELKHGSLALVDATMPVITCASSSHFYADMEISMGEVHARDGELFVLTDEPTMKVRENRMHVICLEKQNPLASSIAFTIALQLLAYHTAVLLGKNVDKPRNLAKSVTTN